MGFTQKDRLIQIVEGPLGDDEVLLTNLSGRESISSLFTYHIEFYSTKLELQAKDLIGKAVTVSINRFDDKQKVVDPPRYISGYFRGFSGGMVSKSEDFDYRVYRAEIVPWLWFLSQTARSHIYFPEKEDKSIHEIIESVFKHVKDDLHVQPDVDLKGIGDLKNRKVKHCVQYRESDFNFISRMLEQFGVYYFFKHEKDKHTLVLSQKSNYPKCVEDKVKYVAHTGGMTDNHITSWEHNYEFASGKWEHVDYNFETPTTSLKTDSPKISKDLAPDASKYEIYDFPGDYQAKNEGDGDARIRQEEAEVKHNTVSGSSSCRTLTAGHQFNLSAHPDEKVNTKEKEDYLITTIQHLASQPGFASNEESDASYSNNFSCIPSSIVYRPKRLTPKPVVSGIQTGVIVGPKGEEIYTDKYGRVKVCFHWDRETQKIKDSEGENCSCFIRVAQNMAGRKWGFMAIPRIGQEVVIDFLEGDPDRPLVVGSVYNKDQMPHYDPVKHKTRTYFKTNSTKGGSGFNELMFEDKAKNERVFVHAQKDMDFRVRNDAKERVYGNVHSIIGYEKDGKKGGDKYEMIYQDHHYNLKRNLTEHVEGNVQWMIGNGDAKDGGNLDVVVEKGAKIDIGKDGLSLLNAGDEKKETKKNESLTVGGNLDVKVGKNSSSEVGMNFHIKAGMNLVLEAGAGLTLKVGGNFVSINPGGVFIKGSMVGINSGGAAGSGAGAKPQKPEKAEKAKPQKPKRAHIEKSGQKSSK